MIRKRYIALAVILAGLLGIVPVVHAFIITINPGAGLAANPDALNAFNQAANQWNALFSDPITVTINADLLDMGSPTILGSTSPVYLTGAYNTIRDQMVADAADEASNAIVASLPTAAQFTTYIPVGFGLSGSMYATKADLKAMGFGGLDAAFGLTDATISFNSGFTFDFDNSNGVTAGQYDFSTVAAHELGHVLGFISAVDDVDYYLAHQITGDLAFAPLDLFRFGPNANPSTAAQFTNDPRDLRPGVNSYFDDLTNEWAFSTGSYTGDGRQASHWKDDSITGTWIGLMDPTLASGMSFPIAYSDIRALDLIGYDLIPSVPEPATMLLLGLGLVGLAGIKRRFGTYKLRV